MDSFLIDITDVDGLFRFEDRLDLNVGSNQVASMDLHQGDNSNYGQ